MSKSTFSLLSFLVSLAITTITTPVSAQTPSYLSPVLLEPALDSTKCLTASSNTNGAAVSIQPCTGSDAQKWSFVNGAVSVFGGGKCLDVKDGVNADGTKLQVWDCVGGSTNQQFWYNIWDTTCVFSRVPSFLLYAILIRAPPFPPLLWYVLLLCRLSWKDHGRCIDLTDGNTADGNQPQLWSCTASNANQIWNTGYHISSLPSTSEPSQSGTNACGSSSSQSAQCQTAWINDVDDFCLWGPPEGGSTIGDTERVEVAWCTRGDKGARVIPDGTLQGVHFVKTPEYVQVTGVGDFTKINIAAGDAGGEVRVFVSFTLSY
jgi:hypothetical protein